MRRSGNYIISSLVPILFRLWYIYYFVSHLYLHYFVSGTYIISSSTIMQQIGKRAIHLL